MADERVASAIVNWGPRFTANGVDPSDLAEITAAVATWDQWSAAWSRAGARHEVLGRRALADGRRRSGGEHLAQAATLYHFARFLFLGHPDEARVAQARAWGCLTDALAHLDPP